MNDGILHEKDESREGSWIPRRGLVSLLDILGGGVATCSRCERWQSFSALTPQMAVEGLAKSGWECVIGGDDLCPKCAKQAQKDPR